MLHLVRPFVRRIPVALLVGYLPVLLCGCHVWKAHVALKDLRQEIQLTERQEMEEQARYHLSVARGLLEAAEKQYEEADFGSAARFSRQGLEQLERARGLSASAREAESALKGKGP